MQIEMLLPQQRKVELDELKGLLAANSAAEPFDESIVNAAVDLSQRIFHDPEARSHPELLALAYWIRKAEMVRMTAQFRSLQLDQRVLVPRGLVFHLPPRNVDTIFVYSWLLAALTGNRNVIRLSPQRSESTNILLRLLRETLAAASGPASAGTTIVSYGHEAEPTEMLSALCDARVIWGGDQTVEIIRRSPLPPHAKEITFPDRYSLSALRADAYLTLREDKRDSLADQFFNDSFWFDQLACSSPRLVVWCGIAGDARAASADFFPRVVACIERRQYALPAAASMQKFVYACSAILRSPVKECRRHNGLTVLTLDSLAGFDRSHPGGGLFYEADLGSLVDLAAFLGRRDQTLTCFGFPTAELQALIRKLNGRAIDRIVPIGQALQFHRFWDGYDLLQEFCRCVYIESTFQDVRPAQGGNDVRS
ncbi:MAG: acyl-CoA reductase [Terriglobales bacterium]